MSGLSRKKIKVRGKNGKTFQRSVMVKSDRMTSGQLLRRHAKTAALSGFGVGALAAAGTYAGTHVGSHFGYKAASREYAKNPIKGPAGAHRFESTQLQGAKIGNIVGGLSGAVGGMLIANRNHHVQSMQRDIERNQDRPGSWGLAGIHTGSRVLGWGAGMIAAHNVRRAIHKVRK